MPCFLFKNTFPWLYCKIPEKRDYFVHSGICRPSLCTYCLVHRWCLVLFSFDLRTKNVDSRLFSVTGTPPTSVTEYKGIYSFFFSVFYFIFLKFLLLFYVFYFLLLLYFYLFILFSGCELAWVSLKAKVETGFPQKQRLIWLELICQCDPSKQLERDKRSEVWKVGEAIEASSSRLLLRATSCLIPQNLLRSLMKEGSGINGKAFIYWVLLPICQLWPMGL